MLNVGIIIITKESLFSQTLVLESISKYISGWRLRRLTVKKQVDMLCFSEENFERRESSCYGERVCLSKTLVWCAIFWSLWVMLMNIAICMWGLKSALLVKNAWFHNSSVITILTHSNKGLPSQLHKWGVISKGGHTHVAFCIQATHLISPPSH